MLKTDKERVVVDLVERLRTSETLIVADYRGLTHKELDSVRTDLLKAGARFSVVKNTLTRRAAEEAGVEALLGLLDGPTAIAFVHDGDMVAVAKTLDETARTTRRLSLKGGVLSGRAIDADGVKGLASLPPADVLRGQVLGAIVAPLTGLAGLLNAPLQDLVGLIDARIDQLGGAAPADVPEEVTSAAPTEPETVTEEQESSETTPEIEPEAEEPAAEAESTNDETQTEEQE